MTIRVNIESDGTPTGSKVTNAETGEILPCTRVEIFMKPDDCVHARLEVLCPRVKCVADGNITEVCPYCGKST
jgi:hypothetical protein